MDRLYELGYLTVRLDSKEVHRQAESVDSSTDKTAVRAIAKTMLNRDARPIDGMMFQLSTVVRALDASTPTHRPSEYSGKKIVSIRTRIDCSPAFLPKTVRWLLFPGQAWS